MKKQREQETESPELEKERKRHRAEVRSLQEEVQRLQRELERLEEEVRMARMTPRERFFHVHGDHVQSDGWIYFRDGAVMETSSYGIWKSPDLSKPRETARNVLHFHRLRYERALREFEAKKASLARHANAAMASRDMAPPSLSPEQAVAELEALRKKAMPLWRAYEKAQKEFDGTVPEKLRQRQELDAQRKSEHNAVLNAIENINL